MGKIQFHPIIVAILLCEFDAIQGPRLALSTTSFDYLLNENPALNSNFSSSSSAPSQTSSESTDSTTYPIEDSSISPSSYVQSEPDTGDSLSTWRFLFDAVSEYLIPKPAFCGSFISVATDQFKVLGFPVLLEDPKYPRNTALWNVALVVPLNEDAQGLQPIVVKIARVFLSFEMECQFITNPNTRPVLKSILSQILLDLNTLRECRISLTPTTSLDLKLFPVYYNPPEVHLWDVPVPLLDLDLQQMEDWDITMKRVFAFIDGVHPIGIIADLADSNIELVKLCIQHLLYYGAVKLVDFFQFSNIYVVTPKLRQLARNERLQQECIQFVTYPGGVVPTPTRLFTLYSYLKMGSIVHDFISASSFPLNHIDIRRFFCFGCLKGWIRRVHKYPILNHPCLPLDAFCVLWRIPAKEVERIMTSEGISFLLK